MDVMSRQASTWEPADSDLQGEVFMDPALVNGTRVDFDVFDLSGSIYPEAHKACLHPMWTLCFVYTSC